jgi:lipopolysaccharide/colanic/teichoic acid biosynthesis glycosyltransferase
LVTWPIIFIAWIVASIETRSNGLFIQKRVGKGGKLFNVYKIKTMKKISGVDTTITSANDIRITNSGRFFRKYKIDELPQLFNVLKGDMSLVGPRPEVMKFVKQKQKEYKKVLSVKPGITDNAAIEFRNEETIMEQYEDKEKAYIDIILPKKIELYYKYIDNISLFNDIKLILKTLKII